MNVVILHFIQYNVEKRWQPLWLEKHSDFPGLEDVKINITQLASLNQHRLQHHITWTNSSTQKSSQKFIIAWNQQTWQWISFKSNIDFPRKIWSTLKAQSERCKKKMSHRLSSFCKVNRKNTNLDTSTHKKTSSGTCFQKKKIISYGHMLSKMKMKMGKLLSQISFQCMLDT